MGVRIRIEATLSAEDRLCRAFGVADKKRCSGMSADDRCVLCNSGEAEKQLQLSIYIFNRYAKCYISLCYNSVLVSCHHYRISPSPGYQAENPYMDAQPTMQQHTRQIIHCLSTHI